MRGLELSNQSDVIQRVRAHRGVDLDIQPICNPTQESGAHITGSCHVLKVRIEESLMMRKFPSECPDYWKPTNSLVPFLCPAEHAICVPQ